MPNRSNVSRSYQLAERHTPVSESISGFAPGSLHFTRNRTLRDSESRWYTTSKRGSAGYQSTPVTVLSRTYSCLRLQRAADRDDMLGGDDQRQFAAIEFYVSQILGIRREQRGGVGMRLYLFGSMKLKIFSRTEPPGRRTSPAHLFSR